MINVLNSTLPARPLLHVATAITVMMWKSMTLMLILCMSAVESFKKIRFSLSRDAEMAYYVKLRLLRRAFRGFVVEQTPPE